MLNSDTVVISSNDDDRLVRPCASISRFDFLCCRLVIIVGGLGSDDDDQLLKSCASASRYLLVLIFGGGSQR